MGYYCPETGLKITNNPEWINQKVSNSFTTNFWIINDSIIYSRPQGYADLLGVRNSTALNNIVAKHITDVSSFVQIEDYVYLEGSSIKARRYFTKQMNDNNRLLSLIFCNLSQPLSIAVNIGNHLKSTGRVIHVKKNYIDAIKHAFKLSDQEIEHTDMPSINLKGFNDKTAESLWPVELFFEDKWDIKTPGFSNYSIVIDRCILHSTSEGCLESEHVHLIDKMRSEIQSCIPDYQLKYIVVDSGKLESVTRSARVEYMKSLTRWHEKSLLGTYIVYGTNAFIKTALHLSRPFLPFKIKIVQDINQAFEFINADRSGGKTKNVPAAENRKPVLIKHEDLEKITAVIGGINWEKEGIYRELEFGEDHPLYFIYQSLKLVKDELDDLLKERKDFQEQLNQIQKAESLGRMAGAIAHHFNNQLSVVMGNLELVLDDLPDDAEYRENLFQAFEGGRKAAEVGQQMLRYLGHISGSQTTINLSDVCRQSLAFLQSALSSGVTLNVDFPASGPFVHADVGQIQQILTNLFTNAQESLPDNQGIIGLIIQTVAHENIPTSRRFPLDWQPQENTYACIEIYDTGCGISKEDILKIFDPFYTTKFTGRGMGLPVTMGFLKSHGGCITVDSEPGSGCVFQVYLPVTTEKNPLNMKK